MTNEPLLDTCAPSPLALQERPLTLTLTQDLPTHGYALSLLACSIIANDLQVWSTELSKRLLIQYAKDHSIYDEKHSSTFRPMHKSQWKIQYGDNSYAHGTVGLDTVKVGSIAIHNQAIELAEEM